MSALTCNCECRKCDRKISIDERERKKERKKRKRAQKKSRWWLYSFIAISLIFAGNAVTKGNATSQSTQQEATK